MSNIHQTTIDTPPITHASDLWDVCSSEVKMIHVWSQSLLLLYWILCYNGPCSNNIPPSPSKPRDMDVADSKFYISSLNAFPWTHPGCVNANERTNIKIHQTISISIIVNFAHMNWLFCWLSGSDISVSCAIFGTTTVFFIVKYQNNRSHGFNNRIFRQLSMHMQCRNQILTALLLHGLKTPMIL